MRLYAVTEHVETGCDIVYTIMIPVSPRIHRCHNECLDLLHFSVFFSVLCLDPAWIVFICVHSLISKFFTLYPALLELSELSQQLVIFVTSNAWPAPIAASKRIFFDGFVMGPW